MVIITGIDSLEARKKAEERVKNLPTPDQITTWFVEHSEGEVIDPEIEYTYPSGHKRKGYYMDKVLKNNLDNFFIPAVEAKWDGVALCTGLEGCQPVGSKVLMADGEWKNIEDVKRGDFIKTPFEKKPSLVTSIVAYQELMTYTIKKDNNILYMCSENHNITVTFDKGKTLVNVETKYMFDNYKNNTFSIVCEINKKKEVISGVHIEKIGLQKCHGISVNHILQRYITNNYCVTSNSGKSTMVMSISRYIDPTFPGPLVNDGTTRRHCDRIVFSPKQFMDAVDTALPKQCIVWDEAIMGFMAADASSEIQKTLVKKLVTIRKKQLYIFFVIPSIFLLRMYMAMFRTRFLLHGYTPDGVQRGYFKFYSYETKRKLFVKGKKDFDQDIVKFDFGGRFTDTSGLFFPLDEYESKKDEAIKSITEEPEKVKVQWKNKEYLVKGQRDLLISILYRDQKRLSPTMSFIDFAEWFNAKTNEIMRMTGEGLRLCINNAERFKENPDPEQKRKNDRNTELMDKLGEE